MEDFFVSIMFGKPNATLLQLWIRSKTRIVFVFA